MEKSLLPHPSVYLDADKLELIKGYRVHEERTPERPVRLLTPSQTIGPFYPKSLIRDGDDDLRRVEPGGPMAEGTPMTITGTVSDCNGDPVRGALIEIWQADKNGKYNHPADSGQGEADPNFKGFGRILTDAEGRYRFLSIIPGAYPNPGYDDWFRPPHVHFSIFGAGLMQRLITQMFFPDEPLNDIDPILNGIDDPAARASLIGRKLPRRGDEALIYAFNIVLRGAGETPFFVDRTKP